MTNLKEMETEVDNYFKECERLRKERELEEVL
jgi:hypothetical protein